jgi:hypothetical protein
MTSQPIDANNNPLPALRLKKNGAHNINASATTARNAAAFDEDTKIISVYATVPVYIAMGSGDVEADSGDHYYPDGIYYDFAIEGAASAHYTHIAVLRADSVDGTVYISEKE